MIFSGRTYSKNFPQGPRVSLAFSERGHWFSQAGKFQLNFLMEKHSTGWSNQAGKTISTASEFSSC